MTTYPNNNVRITVGTYFCDNRKNHGVHVCSNLEIQQKPLEELVLRKIEEIVFDEARIPAIVQAYHELRKESVGEVGEKLCTMQQSLKTIEQKISNMRIHLRKMGKKKLEPR